ncbi:MAG TPA: hypothetical protein VLX28_28100, partial [Thermoanaerobaculia bacterium]|nr:hypothetical protein [Thermoanaerobaculia bacterium]
MSLDGEPGAVWIGIAPRRLLALPPKTPAVRGRPLLVHVEIEARAKPGMEERLWRYRNQILARYD